MIKPIGLRAVDRQNFFREGHLLLEELLTNEHCSQLFQELSSIWKSRLENPLVSLQAIPDKRLMGGDLWRDSKSWFLRLRHLPIGNLARQLWSRTDLRLLFDQVICPMGNLPGPDPFDQFTLQSLCEFRGLVGGILVCLHADMPDAWSVALSPRIREEEESQEVGEDIVVPSKPGTGVFVKGDTQLKLQCAPSARRKWRANLWILIAFGEKNALYTRSELNPHPFVFSRPDYSHGKLSRDDMYPLL